MKIYTKMYFPFTMGGDVWQARSCEVPEEMLDGPHYLGRDYRGYLITTPHGHYVVAEATTGALVGPNLKEVIEDIKTGDWDLMDSQMEQAQIDSTQAQPMDPDEFWRRWEKSAGESQAEVIADSLSNGLDNTIS